MNRYEEYIANKPKVGEVIYDDAERTVSTVIQSDDTVLETHIEQFNEIEYFMRKLKGK